LGFIYFVAFTSFGVQIPGLIGSHGIEPASEFLDAFRGGRIPFWDLPTMFWWSANDSVLRAGWIAGALLSLAAIFTPWRRAALAGCLVLWISFCVVGQDFLSFQWDSLLCETGFLAIFADDSRERIWLFRWLFFRLMFLSGAVKLLSGDPSWRNLTAMHFHYETQPLPTPLAWYMYQLPMPFQRLSTAFVFFAELIVPLFFFATRRLRYLAGLFTIGLQILILLTGNYAYFNLLAIVLAMFIFIEPVSRARSRQHRATSIAIVAFVAVVSAVLLLDSFGLPLPPGGGTLLHVVSGPRIINSYGLFAVMTTTRPEIQVEGSDDAVNWRAYEFKYKPGDILRPPPLVAPHQPRLDWQMWFAALGSYQQNRWIETFMLRLLQGEPSVLALLRYNPFSASPPKYVRARVFLYDFTTFGENGWWRRQEKGLYFPAVSLKDHP
jgi:hypothetical protein